MTQIPQPSKLVYEPHPIVDALLDAPMGTLFSMMRDLKLQRSQGSVTAPPTPTNPISFNSDQQVAWDKINAWLKGSERYFALKGVAGSGKTFLTKQISTLNYNFHFSAPTNKASKVISSVLGVDVRTTYSLLGLRMSADEDQMVLTRSPDAPFLGADPIIVIDEAGMLNSVLIDILRETGHRCLFIGDPAQLNPIGESRSRAWSLAGKNRALLTKVERFDNELLALSIAIRDRLKSKDFRSPIVDNNSNGEGVFLKTRSDMMRDMFALKMEDWAEHKVCAWRNSTVSRYNELIRKNLGLTKQYEEGESVLLAAPYLQNRIVVGYTDEDLTIKSVTERKFRLDEGDFDGYEISFVDRGWSVNVPKDQDTYQSICNRRAGYASQLDGVARKLAWRKFWELKEMFTPLRYGYALTAHRLQGSTLNHVFLDQADILANQQKMEAFRCLYVGATRARKSLTTF